MGARHPKDDLGQQGWNRWRLVVREAGRRCAGESWAHRGCDLGKGCLEPRKLSCRPWASRNGSGFCCHAGELRAPRTENRCPPRQAPSAETACQAAEGRTSSPNLLKASRALYVIQGLGLPLRSRFPCIFPFSPPTIFHMPSRPRLDRRISNPESTIRFRPGAASPRRSNTSRRSEL